MTATTRTWTVSADTLGKYCPVCQRFAVLELPQWLKDEQPDNTTHVCFPGLGGCNQGFGPSK